MLRQRRVKRISQFDRIKQFSDNVIVLVVCEVLLFRETFEFAYVNVNDAVELTDDRS